MEKIRILIASDLPEYRQELTEMLSEEQDFLIIGEAVNGPNAVKKSEHLVPDIILMDINAPITEGIEATEKITLAHPGIGVIIISVNEEAAVMRQAMMAGAGDIIYKNQVREGEVAQSIRRLYQAQKNPQCQHHQWGRRQRSEAPCPPGRNRIRRQRWSGQDNDGGKHSCGDRQ